MANDFTVKIKRDAIWYARVLWSAAYRFYWDNGFSKAASLAYTTLFSLVPVTVFGFGILTSVVLADSQMLSSVRDFIFRQFVPNAAGVDTILNYLSQFSTQVLGLLQFKSETFQQSSIVLVFLIISCFVLLNSIEYALNEVWQVYESRTINQRISVFCTLIVLLPAFAVSAFFASVTLKDSLIGASKHSGALIDFMAPWLIDMAAFSALYSLIPKASVKIRNALIGGFVAALLFGLAKSGFTTYVTQFSSYEKIYGTISTVLIFLFWMYLSWSIVLFGAEVSYQAQHLSKNGEVWKRKVMSVGNGVYLLAIQALIRLGKSYDQGEAPPTLTMLAEELGCSTIVLRPAISGLKKAGCVALTDQGALSLLKSPEKIMLSEVRDAVLAGTDMTLHFSDSLSRVFSRSDFSGTLREVM